MNKIDYFNKNPELKNIYRSYNALQIFLAKDNLQIILDRFDGSLDKIITVLRDGFDSKNNCNLEHVMILIRALISERPREALEILLNEKKIVLLMMQCIENKFVYLFLNQLLFKPMQLMIDPMDMTELVIPYLINCRFFEILLDISVLSTTKLEQAVLEFILDKEKKLQKEKERQEKERAQEEEENFQMKTQQKENEISNP